jgi:exodeoxyribonuclease V gamma subunit
MKPELSPSLGIKVMKSLRLFTGNKLDLLAQALAKVLETRPASPLDTEIIVVQSKGMERWVSMQLATHFGVCANCRFPFPNTFAYEIFQHVLPDLPESSVFDPKYSTWKVMEILLDHLDETGFADLKHYLDGSRWSLKQLQLSGRIADTFDQYLLYRPEMITRWEAGEEDHWQAIVWRDLAKGFEQRHRAALGKIMLEKIRQTAPGADHLPRRVSIFGISYLPPFHLHLFEGLSRLTEVNLFLLNPCREYWGDIVSERDFGRIASRREAPPFSPEELFLEKGNPLLASTGALGKDFFELLTSFDHDESTFFRDPGDTHLLACIQSDILNLRDRLEHSKQKTTVSEEDRSIQIHSCHSPMRELEVLYDHLLEMFESIPGLLPKDILVMAPAIETYAPFVQAVFDAPEDEGKRIPYSIADRCMRKESRVADTFLALLDLWGERLTAPQVLGILESPAVQARFGLTDVDLDLIVRWVGEVRIRWGIDEHERNRWSSNASRENTWRAGLERLLLGYALPGKDQHLFEGILPYDHIEGAEASVLGNFVAFVEELFRLVASLNFPKTLDQWSAELLNVLERFFQPGEDSTREIHALRQIIADLGRTQEISGFREELEIRVIKWYLGRYLEREGFGLGFMTGGVTFCSMLPMRSIPFRVICLIGMDGNAYPRQTNAPDFDLMAKHPRPGDRSARNDDRYLFLEAIISAQKKLYISYTGQSCRDNSTIPPSVLVSELLDYINHAFAIPHGPGPNALVIKHRLQPFSPAYFKSDQELFTYSAAREREASCLLKEKTRPPLFIPTVISPPEEELKTIDIGQLCRFFGNPARFLLIKRFRLKIDETSSLLEETESFGLTGLEKYTMEQSLLESRMAGNQIARLFSSLKAAGKLPHGIPGECAFEAMSHGVEDFARQLEPHLLREEMEPLEIDLQLAGFAITGRISSIFAERMLRYRYAKIKARDHLSLWIQHLVLNTLRTPGYPRASMIAGLHSGDWHAQLYAPVEDSREILESLLQEYWSGLSKPLHFFPETSLHYAQLVLQKGKSPDDALCRAESTWLGNDFNRGECKDPHFDLCFKSGNPLDAEFQRLAEGIFSPLLASQQELTSHE